MKLRSLTINSLYFAVLIVLQGVAVLTQNQIAHFETDRAILKVDVLKEEKFASIPIFVATVAGDQGKGKSTMLRAIAQWLGLDGGFFKVGSTFSHCTTDLAFSDPSPTGIVLGDQMGQNKENLSADVQLSSENVDLMAARLVGPISNVLIQFVDDSIKSTDLNTLALYTDEKTHLGQLGAASIVKPSLLLVLKTDREELDNGVPFTEQAYLESVIKPTSLLHNAFSSIDLIVMPYVFGGDKKLLSDANFHPERVPAYWTTVQRISDYLQTKADAVPVEKRWSGSQVATILETILPVVNEGGEIVVHTMRMSLLLSQVKLTAAGHEQTMKIKMETYTADPFSPSLSVDVAAALTALRTNHIKECEDKYIEHKGDVKLWTEIQKTIAVTLETVTNNIAAAVAAKKVVIKTKEQDAYETARSALSAHRANLAVTGKASEVDTTFINLVRKVIEDFKSDAKTDNCAPSPNFNNLVTKLQTDGSADWTSAHNANYATYLTTRQRLSATPIPAVSMQLDRHARECSNHHSDFNFKLADYFPQYFGSNDVNYLLSVYSVFRGSGGNGGAFNLNAGAGEAAVSSGRESGGRSKYKSNAVYYNHGNTNLHVNVGGGGGWGNPCTNAWEMHGVTLTVTQNALVLPENEAYKNEYTRQAFPANM